MGITHSSLPCPDSSAIGGIVVNGSRDEAPVAGAEVVLRVLCEGKLAVGAAATADTTGAFRSGQSGAPGPGGALGSVTKSFGQP